MTSSKILHRFFQESEEVHVAWEQGFYFWGKITLASFPRCCWLVFTDSLSTRITNFACRIILGIKKFNLISAARKSLGWLSVRQTLLLNTVTMVQRCRTNQAPPYLCSLFHDRFSVSGRSTRNMSQLNLPKSRLSTGQRSFAFLGAKEYNLLLENIRNLNNISSFKRKVAAHFLRNFS